MSLRKVLLQSNLDLLREIEQLLRILQNASNFIPTELYTYCQWVIAAFQAFYNQVNQNLNDLALGHDAILLDILSNTQKIRQYLCLFNQRLFSPILRTQPSDRLCLKLLQWLHSTHPQTQKIPLAFIDGDFASWSAKSLPTIYFIPPSVQHGLLYLPILFHEFGHLLYVCHKPEMQDLVSSLQKQIYNLLEPGSQRDDAYALADLEKRITIVEVWYEWTQEIFCDAVGLTIGGSAFLHAFSMYLKMLGRGEYYLEEKDLSRQGHPVTWLRVKLLAERARQMKFSSIAEQLEENWEAIAKVLNIREDYYGFYEPEFLPAVQQTIDDMLIEAEPRCFTDSEVNVTNTDPFNFSPIKLLNQAWYYFFNKSAEYSRWEEQAILIFLKEVH
jgi:hypothetical protein